MSTLAIALENNTKKDAEQMATKADLRNEIALVRKEMATRADIELLHKEIAIVRRDIIIWLGGVLVVGFGLILRALSKLPV